MFYESRLLVDLDSRSLRFVHFNILKNSLVYSIALSSPRVLVLKAGAKVRLVFHSPNFSSFFFKLFFREPFQTLLSTISFKPFLVLALSLESGCKDKAIKYSHPNFSNVIFEVFYKILPDKELQRLIFTVYTRVKVKKEKKHTLSWKKFNPNTILATNKPAKEYTEKMNYSTPNSLHLSDTKIQRHHDN